MGDFSKEIKSVFRDDKVKAYLNIKYTANLLNSFEADFFKPFGISSQQYNILRILRGAKEPLKVQDIKEIMVERSPNATRIIDKLLKNDYIQRDRCDNDRRVVYIEIKEEGLELLSKIEIENRKDPLDNLTMEEATNLSNLLDKLRD